MSRFLFIVCLVIPSAIAVYCPGADGTKLQIETVSFAPHSRLRPGRVTVIRAFVRNQGSEAAEGMLVARVDSAPTEEGARHFRLQAGERKYFDLYFHVPNNVKLGEYVNISVSLTVIEGGRQVMLTGSNSALFQTLRLPVETDPVVTALLMDPVPLEVPPWQWKQPPIHDSYEMAVAARLDADYSRRCVQLDGELLPCQIADWETIDCLIIADDTRLEDEASLQSIRRWMHSGGHVWIMLDRVRCQSLRGLLSDGQVCEELDTVELNRFTIDPVDRVNLGDEDRLVQSEVPIKFKRVVQQGGDVSHSIDSWPAAIWMPAGHGQLLLTTLGAQAWLRGRVSPKEKRGPSFEGPYALAQWAGFLAAGFHEPRNKRPMESHDLEYPLRHIGNPVLPKSMVLVVLLSYCGLLVGLGVWQYSRASLNRIGWIAPLLAALSVLPLLMASAWIRRDIPDCISRLQIVEVLDGGSAALVREKMAVYMDSPLDSQLAASTDAITEAAPSDLSSGIRRWVWTDFQKWHLSNSAWPSGLWRLDQEYAVQGHDLYAEGRLEADGLKIKLPEGLPSRFEDAVLSYIPGDPVICSNLPPQSLFVGRTPSVSGDKWIAGTLINDEQVRRIEVYKELFSDDRTIVVWNSPSLYGWTKAWDGRPGWQHAFEQRGAAFVALPIRLQPVSPGQKVLIPHSLVHIYKPYTKVGMSSAFTESSGRWSDPATLPASIVLQYRLPQQAVPLRVESIDVELQIRAPQRRVVLSALSAEPPVEIGQWQGPLGALRQTISDSRILEDAGDGLLELKLDLGEKSTGAGDPSTPAEWQVDHLRIDVVGTTTDRVTLGK